MNGCLIFDNIFFSPTIFSSLLLSIIFAFDIIFAANISFVIFNLTFQTLPNPPFPIIYKNSNKFLFTKLIVTFYSYFLFLIYLALLIKMNNLFPYFLIFIIFFIKKHN